MCSNPRSSRHSRRQRTRNRLHNSSRCHNGTAPDGCISNCKDNNVMPAPKRSLREEDSNEKELSCFGFRADDEDRSVGTRRSHIPRIPSDCRRCPRRRNGLRHERKRDECQYAARNLHGQILWCSTKPSRKHPFDHDNCVPRFRLSMVNFGKRYLGYWVRHVNLQPISNSECSLCADTDIQ